MLTFSLQSGSNGNAIYVEAGGKKLLFDAGISGNLAAARMQQHGRDIREVDAMIISHDHVDHVRCAGVYQRKFGIPLHITQKTLQATWCKIGPLTDVQFFTSGDALTFGPVTVHTIPTAHDAADGVAFVVECEGKKLGVLTDLGHPFRGLQQTIESLDAAYLEANYDVQMLKEGSYPWHLKQRISGPGGHISNCESAAMLRGCGRHLPKWIAVAHLSADNNRPYLAVSAQHAAVGEMYPVRVASRDAVSDLWEV